MIKHWYYNSELSTIKLIPLCFHVNDNGTISVESVDHLPGQQIFTQLYYYMKQTYRKSIKTICPCECHPYMINILCYIWGSCFLLVLMAKTYLVSLYVILYTYTTYSQVQAFVRIQMLYMYFTKSYTCKSAKMLHKQDKGNCRPTTAKYSAAQGEKMAPQNLGR